MVSTKTGDARKTSTLKTEVLSAAHHPGCHRDINRDVSVERQTPVAVAVAATAAVEYVPGSLPLRHSDV